MAGVILKRWIGPMEKSLKVLALALVVSAALARPGSAQQEATKNAPANATAAGAGESTANGGAAAGAVPARSGPDVRSNDVGKDTNRRDGSNSARGAGPNAPNGPGGVLSHGINLTTPDNGYAGLQRRANRKALILNAAKKPSGPLDGGILSPQIAHPRADGAVATRNAVGMMVPGAGGAVQGAGAPHGPSDPGHRPTANSVAGAVVAPAPHASAINGTTISRIGSGPGSIGGPVKDRSGINGTSLRPRP